jgi:hypothetical protein
MMVQRHDGSLWMLVRTAYGIGGTVSTDMGRTWSEVTPSAIPHTPSRFFIRRLNSGSLLLVKHGSMHERTGRSHLTALVSRDDGVTWEGGLVLDERSTVSYPDGCQSPDGLIRVIYDWNRADEKHVLMTAFTEADALAGHAVSGRVRERVLVNRATGVNDKPWLKDGRFLGLKPNTDGAAFVSAPGADLIPEDGAGLRTVTVGAAIFADRSYTFHDQVPDCLRQHRFVFSGIDTGTAAVCRTPGPVHVITPSPGRNPDSVAPALLEQGFVKLAVPEFVLFLSPAGHAASGNVCSVYRKHLEAGERIALDKWGVVLTAPAE